MLRNILSSMLVIVGASVSPHFAVGESISGSVPDVARKITASGMAVMANFGQITYEAQLANIQFAGIENDRVEFDVQLSDISLRIGRTSLQGSIFSANVATLPIELARTRPLVVRYVARQTQSGLSLQDTQLSLSTVDMQIGNPNVVRTSGFGATKSRVGKGLRDGLRNNRDAIEGILLGEARNIFSKVEPQLLATIPTEEQPASANRIATAASPDPQPESAQPVVQNEQTLANKITSQRAEPIGESIDSQTEASLQPSRAAAGSESISLFVAASDDRQKVATATGQAAEPAMQEIQRPVGKIAGRYGSKTASTAKNEESDSMAAGSGEVIATSLKQNNSKLQVRTLRRFASVGLVYCQPVRPQLGTRLLRLLRVQ